MADRLFHLNLVPHRRQLSIYASGSPVVRIVNTSRASAIDGISHAQLDESDARAFVDSLAAATGHYPCEPNIDAERARVTELAAGLRVLRGSGGEPAELAELALARHVGHHLANAAELIYLCRDHLEDRTVAELLAEVIGMCDLMMYGHQHSNPEERIAAHRHRIQDLREQLPQPGQEPLTDE